MGIAAWSRILAKLLCYASAFPGSILAGEYCERQLPAIRDQQPKPGVVSAHLGFSRLRLATVHRLDPSLVSSDARRRCEWRSLRSEHASEGIPS